MTDDEINQVVARKLGSTVKCGCDCLAPTDQPDNEWTHPLHYSTDIRAAWEIVETDKLVGFTLFRDWDSGKWTVQVEAGAYAGAFIVGRDFPYECKYTEADTAPMAICLAFLKLP